MIKKLKTDSSEAVENFTFSLPGIFSTKLDLVDWALSGGVPMGRLTTITGLEGVGKTSFALHIAGHYLNKKLGKLYYYEGEGKPPLSEYIFKVYGISDMGKVVALRPNCLESLLDDLESKIHEIDTGIIIIDSLASFGPSREGKKGEEGKIKDDPRLGQAASKNTLFATGKFFKILSKKEVIVLMINQLRDNINAYTGGSHSPGGKALQYQSSQEIRLEKYPGPPIQDSDKNIVGQLVNFNIKRNMIGPPFREAIVPYYFETGWDNEESVLIEGVGKGSIKVSGGWYEWKGEKIRKKDLLKLMKTNAEVYAEILGSLNL